MTAVAAGGGDVGTRGGRGGGLLVLRLTGLCGAEEDVRAVCEAEAAALDVVVCLVGASDTEHAVREIGKDEQVYDGSRDQRADEGDDGEQEGIGIERLAFLLVVGYHLIHGGGKCGESLGVFVLLQGGDELFGEVFDAFVVGDAHAHLVV